MIDMDDWIMDDFEMIQKEAEKAKEDSDDNDFIGRIDSDG